MERLQKILSAHGVVSRREAERLIVEGRVAVNGKTASLGQSADIYNDIIKVDGAVIAALSKKVYIMLNKPRGYVTTLKDERGRKNVAQLVSDVGVRVYPAGRLDMDSEGLLLLTNDGLFANAVMHPSFEKEKIYRVTVRGDDLSNAVSLLLQPMVIDIYKVRAARAVLLKTTEDGGIIDISITEGRNRQIRKMCELCKLDVKRLRRIAVGDVELGSLQSGKWRHLTSGEIKALFNPSGGR